MSDKQNKTCFDKTKQNTLKWWEIFKMPVEYPVSESSGKGWNDPVIVFVGHYVVLPKQPY